MKKRRDFTWDSGWTLSVFSRMVRQVAGRSTIPEEAGETSEPFMDIFEESGDLVVEMEAPGIYRGDISIRIDGGYLRVEGFKRDAAHSGCIRYFCLERQSGAFRRVVPLPFSVDASSTRATLKQGLLRIVLPRIRERRRSVVEVPVTEAVSPEEDR